MLNSPAPMTLDNMRENGSKTIRPRQKAPKLIRSVFQWHDQTITPHR